MNVETQTLQPVKRTRAKGPKVKTGCGTCKIRHLKCDEGKPACRRCTNDDRKCDGYNQPMVRKSRTTKTFQMIPFIPKSHKVRKVSPSTPRPALISDIFVDSGDAALYFHARECAINDFETAAYSSGFWNAFVLPLSHTVKPIKHALCALGGAHRLFTSTHPGTIHSNNMELESIQKYNEAIMHMTPLMMDNTIESIQTTLICCMIFICVESMYGRYAEAARHLKAGCQLLNSYRRELATTPTLETCQDELLDSLEAMMTWFGQNLSIYKGELVFVDIERKVRTLDVGSSFVPFTSIQEAADVLIILEHIFDQSMLDHNQDELRLNYPHWSSGQQQGIGCSPPWHPRFIKTAAKSTKQLFKIWNARFELTKTKIDKDILSLSEKRKLGLVSLGQAMWNAFLKLADIEDEYSIEDSADILDCVENVLALEEVKSRRLFTVEGDLVSAVSIVCGSCRDVQVQARGAALLRRMNRREGVWDSIEMANLYETIIKAVEDDHLVWDDLPLGVPQLMEEMSRLQL